MSHCRRSTFFVNLSTLVRTVHISFLCWGLGAGGLSFHDFQICSVIFSLAFITFIYGIYLLITLFPFQMSSHNIHYISILVFKSYLVAFFIISKCSTWLRRPSVPFHPGSFCSPNITQNMDTVGLSDCNRLTELNLVFGSTTLGRRSCMGSCQADKLLP